MELQLAVGAMNGHTFVAGKRLGFGTEASHPIEYICQKCNCRLGAWWDLGVRANYYELFSACGFRNSIDYLKLGEDFNWTFNALYNEDNTDAHVPDTD